MLLSNHVSHTEPADCVVNSYVNWDLTDNVTWHYFLYLQIDGKMLKDLDHSLFIEDEMQTVFEELMKTVPKDHLKTSVVCGQINV